MPDKATSTQKGRAQRVNPKARRKLRKSGRGADGLAVAAYADRPPKRSGIDQNRNDGLGETDQGEHEKLGVVEDSEGLHTGRPKRKKQDLNTRDCTHQEGLDGVVNSGSRDS